MRLRLTLRAVPRERLVLPFSYNELIQAFLYRHLDAHLARRLHDEGIPDPAAVNRRLKLFVFSRLLGRWRPRGDHRIAFYGPVQLVVASPIGAFLESLAVHLLQERQLRLGLREFELVSLEVEPLPPLTRPLLVEALSPITVYSTLYTAEGKRKTYYYSPFEAEFEELLLKNLARKVRTWYGKEIEAEGHIRPVKVSPRDEHVLKYKGTVIKAWTGIYELELPPALFEMAFAAGLGAKNSQGFGCIGVWRSRPLVKERREGRSTCYKRFEF
jgi:CRISPR-associated endoribonuclease Cas6